MAFGVSEYKLVFRRILSDTAGPDQPTGRWVMVRPDPEIPARASGRPSVSTREREIAEVLIVPFYSTLALDDLAYERFLRQSGALDDALELLSAAALAELPSADTIRKEITSLIIAAEVQYIVDGMSA